MSLKFRDSHQGDILIDLPRSLEFKANGIRSAVEATNVSDDIDDCLELLNWSHSLIRERSGLRSIIAGPAYDFFDWDNEGETYSLVLLPTFAMPIRTIVFEHLGDDSFSIRELHIESHKLYSAVCSKKFEKRFGHTGEPEEGLRGPFLEILGYRSKGKDVRPLEWGLDYLVNTAKRRH